MTPGVPALEILSRGSLNPPLIIPRVSSCTGLYVVPILNIFARPWMGQNAKGSHQLDAVILEGWKPLKIKVIATFTKEKPVKETSA
jgi:hypothetical protein